MLSVHIMCVKSVDEFLHRCFVPWMDTQGIRRWHCRNCTKKCRNPHGFTYNNLHMYSHLVDCDGLTDDKWVFFAAFIKLFNWQAAECQNLGSIKDHAIWTVGLIRSINRKPVIFLPYVEWALTWITSNVIDTFIGTGYDPRLQVLSNVKPSQKNDDHGPTWPTALFKWV